jgi:hypothetical protein
MQPPAQRAKILRQKYAAVFLQYSRLTAPFPLQ